MKAASILSSCIDWLAVMSGVHKDAFQALAPHLPQWIKEFVNILRQEDNPESHCGLKINILQIVSTLLGKFPKHIGPYFNELLTPIWSTLVNAQPKFIKFMVEDDLLGEDVKQDSDGTVLGFERLISMVLNVFHIILRKPALSKPLSKVLFELIYLAIGFAQITSDQVTLLFFSATCKSLIHINYLAGGMGIRSK